MKLVIQIPCFNEEKTLPLVLNELPKKLPGISKIEVQIIDDGSRDGTVEVAKKHGVTRIIKHKKNMGLGIAFKDGIEAALDAGADIVVNTDADNQYPSKYIKDLVAPIIANEADIIIGDRRPHKVRHFSPIKRFFQYFGNSLVRKLTGSRERDVVSGFRAYNKKSLLKLNITTQFSYVLDTIVQAYHKDLVIKSVPISVNLPTRRSRLFTNIFQHMRKSGMNVLRCFIIYEPFKFFIGLSVVFFVPAFLLLLRFFIFFFMGSGSGHVQSLIVSAIGFVLGGSMLVLGLVAGVVGINRKLIEEDIYLKRKQMYGK